ncbi:MAG: A/G-specific adenine glycosylase [Deltaproteobacteria bacterium]|nr:A/G-specific adenine glycosylase [Deltaproteobacteria bacterium]
MTKKDADQIAKSLQRRILAWYGRRQRSLPWRETSDPYRIWISEIMLQQTQVDTVIPYYRRFMALFPNVRALARAPRDEVLKAWENLGYYSRARNVHAAARMIVETFDGRIPDTPAAIKTLPGIGEYSAGAILSIAYGKRLPAVDGNVRRILGRVFAIRRPVDDPREQKKLQALAAALVPAGKPGDFNQALMDLGATICKPRNPGCTVCPIAALCQAQLTGTQTELPILRRRPAPPHRAAVCAVIRSADNRLLVVLRPASGLLASLWKLPGGFVGDSGSEEAGLKNSVKNELGVSIRIKKKLASVDHAYTHFRATLSAYDCSLLKGEPAAPGCQEWRWASDADIAGLPMSKIDRKILAAITLRRRRTEPAGSRRQSRLIEDRPGRSPK